MKKEIDIKYKHGFYYLFGIVLLLLLWQFAAIKSNGLVISKPFDTLLALGNMLVGKNFYYEALFPTVTRVAFSIFTGVALGSLFGILAGIYKPVELVFAPLRWILMSIPGIIVVVVFMIWFGMGSLMVIAITSTMISPILYVNMIGGIASIDKGAIEMANVYHFSLWMKFRYIYIMALIWPFFTGSIVAVGNGIRYVILAEMLGASTGLGHSLALSRTNLEIEDLYAIALLSMLIIGGVEWIILRPARKYIIEKKR